MELLRDDITNFQVHPVPESNSSLGMLALGIGGAGMLLKRKMNRKRAAVRAYAKSHVDSLD